MIKNQLLRAVPLREFNSVFPHLRAVRLKKRRPLHKARAPLSEVYFLDGAVVSCVSVAPEGGRQTAVSIIGNEGLVSGDSLLSGVASFDAVVQLGV